MKRLLSSALFIVLASLLVSGLMGVPLVGADSQQGGLPALQAEVTALENEVAALEAATAFISMNGDGTINYSKDVDTSSSTLTGRTGTGFYQVKFTRDVSTCVAVANVHPPLGSSQPAFAMVGRSSSTQVTIAIFGVASGTFAAGFIDDGFELAVLC